MCCILAAVLNIGDIRLETNFHSHIGEVSFVQNSERVHDGNILTLPYSSAYTNCD